jgi:hypothetical protein
MTVEDLLHEAQRNITKASAIIGELDLTPLQMELLTAFGALVRARRLEFERQRARRAA